LGAKLSAGLIIGRHFVRGFLMANIQHNNLAPVFGDLNTGAHSIHHFTFADEGGLTSGDDLNFGTVSFVAGDVGKIAKVGTGNTGSFWVLLNETNATWKKIDNNDVTQNPVKTVSTNTYTLLQADDKHVIQFTHPSGVVLTVPIDLLSGTEATVYALSGVVQFVTGGVGVAVPMLPISLSSSTQEARSVASFQVREDTNTFILAGDLLPIGPDPLTDGDFSSNGRMVRNGAGNYNVILDTLSGTTNPFSGSDFNAGYRVGSLYVDQNERSVFVCVDDTPASASWRNLHRVNELEYDMYIGHAQTGTVIFRDDFLSDIDLWSSTLNGAASSVASSANTPGYGYVFVSPGTTFTGSAAIRTNINILYASLLAGGFSVLNFETVAYLPDAPPDPAQDYYVRVNLFADSGFNTSANCFMAASGNYGVDNYWKMTRYVAGVTSSVNTSFLALTGIGNGLRFRTSWNLATSTASFYINNQFQGIFTGSQLAVPAAGYIAPGMSNKLTGTSARRIAIDYTECWGLFSGSRA
jgi:hypothetical protein